jgi:hypothetical protein
MSTKPLDLAQFEGHTLGPWRACKGTGKCEGECVCGGVWSEPADHPVAEVTRGEWGDSFPSVRLVGESSFDMKAEAYMERVTYVSVDDASAAANARLIAAAPALLAELRERRAKDAAIARVIGAAAILESAMPSGRSLATFHAREALFELRVALAAVKGDPK